MATRNAVAEAGRLIAAVLSRSEGSARKLESFLSKNKVKNIVLGEQLNQLLRPVGSARQETRQDAFAAFWEQTGVVLLEPQVPNANELINVSLLWMCVPFCF
jgi:hypothetical protein